MKLWQPPKYIGFQAPVPPPPDYSTPAAVQARIREFCGRAWFTPDSGFRMLYQELRRAIAATACDEEPSGRAGACPVADWHRSKWRVVREGNAWTLKPAKRARKVA
jgi:hypothetical protein